MGYQTKDIRNLAVLGHAGCGKTTLIESLLFKTKMTSRQGKVTDGTSILDTAPDEKSRQGTIDSALAHADVDGLHINFLDTPGLLDFVADAIGSMGAVETALVCVDAKSGPKVTTRRLWSTAAAVNLPRVILVTRLDQPDTDFNGVVDKIRETFGDKCQPLYIPDASGPGFSKLSSILNPETEGHDEFLESVIESDEAVMERYLEGETISPEELAVTLRKAITAGEVFPILPVSAEKELGLDELLATIKNFLPSPLDRPHALIKDGERSPCDPTSDKFSGLVFKSIQSDAGKLSFIRVMTGGLKSGATLNNLTRETTERGAQIFQIQGKDRSSIDVAVAGDLIAIPKADSLTIGDSVGDSGFEGRYENVKMPQSMVRLAIEPKSRGDASKLLDGLRRLTDECPTFRFDKNIKTGDLIVFGSTKTHLEVMLERLKLRSKIDVERNAPKIPYRETISNKSDAQFRHKKQSGGSGEFAEVWMRCEPTERDAGFEFESKVVGGSISSNYLPSVEKGVRDVMNNGILSGCEIVDVKVVVYDGKEHPVDSKDVAFQKAGRGAFRECFTKGKPILLEPIVKLEVNIPSEYVGDVTSDLASTRRGQITGTDYEGKFAVIKANVPLAEVTEYDAQLRSMTAGEGSFSLEESHYDQVPSNVQQDIVAQYKTDQTDD